MSLVDQVRRDCAKLLVRHFYKALGQSGVPTKDGVDAVDDREFLVLLWALSNGVGEALQYLIAQSRHLVLARQSVTKKTNGSGALMARKSVMLQALTGNPSKFIARKAVPTSAGGANHCLVWFIESVDRAIRRFPHVHSGPWQTTVKTRITEIQQARNLPGISECFASGLHLVPPGSTSLRAAASLRNPLYLKVLAQIKRRQIILRSSVGDSETLAESALVEMETWRQMELLGALLGVTALEEALQATGYKFKRKLNPLLGNGAYLASCGPFEMKWQFITPHLDVLRKASHEMISDNYLAQLGLTSGHDRADLSVHLHGETVPIALGESKYFAKEDNAKNQLSTAIWQITKYADQITAENAACASFASLSFIFIPTAPVVEDAATLADDRIDIPVIIPYRGIKQHERFQRWAQRIVALVHLPELGAPEVLVPPAAV